jgi:hypothetical protein
MDDQKRLSIAIGGFVVIAALLTVMQAGPSGQLQPSPAAGGLLAPASPVSPATLNCDNPQYLTESGGHRGAAIRCDGQMFTGFIDCKMPDGYTYRHFGNPALSGGTSTTWCDLNAVVINAGVTPP